MATNLVLDFFSLLVLGETMTSSPLTWFLARKYETDCPLVASIGSEKNDLIYSSLLPNGVEFLTKA